MSTKKAPAKNEQTPPEVTAAPAQVTAAPIGMVNVDKVLVREPDGSEFLMDPRMVKQHRPNAEIVSYADGRKFVRSEIADLPDVLDDSAGTPENVDPKTGVVTEVPDGDQNQPADQGESVPAGDAQS